MTSSTKPKSGCFSGVSRLLLCKRSLQTHPSDHFEFDCGEFDLYVHKDDKVMYEAKTPAAVQAVNLGVVARLMGLDSLPMPSWLPEGRFDVSKTVTRSRSVNFMDYLLQPADLSADEQNRRVRGSVSFREVPTLLTQQKYESFLKKLDYDKEKSNKMGFSFRKSDEKKQRSSREEEEEVGLLKKERNSMKMGNGRQFSRFGSYRGVRAEKKAQRKSGKSSVSKSKSAVKPMNQTEVFVESKFMKKMKNQNTIEKLQSGFSWKTSTGPASDPGLDKSSITEQPRPLSGDDLRSKTISLPRNATPVRIWEEDSGEDMEPIVIKKNDRHSFESGEDKEYYMSLARELSKLTEKDIQESNWVAINVFDLENFEDVLYDFGQEILDVLVLQVVEELEEFCNTESCELFSDDASSY